MDKITDQIKNTVLLRLFTLVKLPLLAWIRPSLLESSHQRTVLKVPLNRRTKNHLGVMYFGALAMGAEAAIAVKAVAAIQKSGEKVDFLFKDFQAQFLRRAEGDVHFICEQGDEVEALIKKCLASGERETQNFESYAVVPSKDPHEKVGVFKLGLSVKKRR